MANQKAGKKVGRHKRNGQNAAYKSEMRREKSKLRRVLRHMRRYGYDDKPARACAKELLAKLPRSYSKVFDGMSL